MSDDASFEHDPVARYLETGEVPAELRGDRMPAPERGAADDTGRDLADVLADLDLVRRELAEPSTWAEPPPDLEGKVLDAILAAPDLPAASAPPPAPEPPAPSATSAAAAGPAHAAAEDSLVARADHRARRASAVAVVASLVAAAAVVAAIVGFASRSSAPAPESAAPPGTTAPTGPVTIGPGVEAKLKGTELAPDAAGTVRLDETSSGVWIRFNASGLPRRDDGQFYEAWAKTPQGMVPIGTFHTGDKVVLWSGVGIDDTDAITVTLEENDGNQESSGRRVLIAELPRTGTTSPPGGHTGSTAG